MFPWYSIAHLLYGYIILNCDIYLHFFISGFIIICQVKQKFLSQLFISKYNICSWFHRKDDKSSLKKINQVFWKSNRYWKCWRPPKNQIRFVHIFVINTEKGLKNIEYTYYKHWNRIRKCPIIFFKNKTILLYKNLFLYLP